MAQEVIMPQMGESIAEGTITTWLKKVGETVQRDEPLFEISTDKVDAEIPSPASGVLLEIRAQPGQTVPINTVVALVGEPGEAKAGAPAPAPAPAAKKEEPKAPTPSTAKALERHEATAVEQQESMPQVARQAPAAPRGNGAAEPESLEERRRTKSSPLVRKIAAEHSVDITRVPGTGVSGRVTKDDILGYLERAPAAAAKPAAAPARGAAPRPGELLPSAAPAAPAGAGYGVYDARAPIPEAYRPRVFENDRVEPMSTMRAKIAEHMMLSRRISSHVQTVWDVDFTHVAKLRSKYKAVWEERHGVNLTYTAIIMKATVDALKAFPIVNASVDGQNVIYHQNVNLGLAVALDWGLIVPVIHRADELNLLGLARRAADLAGRARSRKLMPDEIAYGTFTITNPGVFGPIFGLPVINQPQVAILGVGAVEKRPVVIDDMIAIRTKAYLSLSFDHRIIDGAVADQFMARVRKGIEEFDEGSL